MHRLLVVEDDAKISTLLKERLERYGYEIHTIVNFDSIFFLH